MISYSQLTEESYVKTALDFEYLAEETQPVRKAKRSEAELTKRNVANNKAREEISKNEVKIATIKKNQEQYVARMEREREEISSDRSLEADQRRAKILRLEQIIAREKQKSDLQIKELEQRNLTQREEIRLRTEQQKQINLETTKRLEAEQQREIRKAEQSFDDLFLDAAKGTVRGVGQASAYTIKSMFSWIAQNPRAAGGVGAAIVLDQIIFNNALMKAIPFMPKSGLIPGFFNFIIGKITGAFSAITTGGILTILSGLITPIAILAASGVGLYVSYRLIRIFLDLGEAKAMQIARKLETASEEETEEILRKDLKLNTRNLKKQRAAA